MRRDDGKIVGLGRVRRLPAFEHTGRDDRYVGRVGKEHLKDVGGAPVSNRACVRAPCRDRERDVP